MRVAILLITFLFSTLAHAESLFAFSNEPGIYSVGVRYIKQYDRSRSYAPQRNILKRMFSSEPQPGRPIQTVIWYPSE